MAAATPDLSKGGRIEREAVRSRLRNQIRYYERLRARKVVSDANCDGAISALQAQLTWMLQRQARYDAASGGLGKK